ncbi:MAG: hypothetical protein PWP23_2456 [Candidatus Sumerlaeota bacterium]|nr:hypothetical protein [Candidatus Sumerlaeota bacterium]
MKRGSLPGPGATNHPTMAHGHLTTVHDPGPVSLLAGLKPVALAMAGGGLLLWLAGFAVNDALRVWQSLLVAYAFFLMLGLGGVVFTAIQYCASARWSIAVRRIAEGMGAYIPVSFVFFVIIVLFGWGTLYDLESPWRAANGKGGVHIYDGLKAAYLSRWGVLIKGVVFYAIWHVLSQKLRQTSIAQDRTKEAAGHKRNVKTSIIFLLLFGYTFSLHCVDMLKALEPKWFSTMFGVYCFSGLFLSTLCTLSLLTIALRRNRVVAEAIQPRHMYDLGTWIMAFSCFMCYIGFSQYMLIWYANLPEEAFYMIERTEGGWEYVFALLPLLKWVIPFAVLMPQGFRANVRVHVFVCVAVLLGQWLDLYWMVYPVFSPAPVLPGLPELGAFLALLGVFGFVLDRVYSSHSVLPVGDPYLKMSVSGSYL